MPKKGRAEPFEDALRSSTADSSATVVAPALPVSFTAASGLTTRRV